MSHRCVAQQVVAYENLKTKEINDQLVIPKSGRGCLRMSVVVAYESFYYRVWVTIQLNGFHSGGHN